MPQAMRRRRREMQIIFQDPLASLNPRMTIGDIIAEPLITHEPQLGRAEVRARVRDMMAKTGLLPQMINRYPHEFSGGQCQRIGVARAMILNPKLIVCDEPVSALDVSIQAQIINLLMELQRAFGLSLLFISHDLSVVRHISQRILVLYLGRMMELADSASLYRRAPAPLHARADLGGAGARSQARARKAAHRAGGRSALAARSALGLRVPHPLPARHRDLRARGAADRAGACRPPSGLPSLARGRARQEAM